MVWWCSLQIDLVDLCDYKINLLITNGWTPPSLPPPSEMGRGKSPCFGPSNGRANHFRPLVVNRLIGPIEQDVANSMKIPPLSVSVSLTLLSQSFSSLWLGGRRFPNKLAETCCLWVRLSSPPAGQQSCHPQCKQVALASRGEWAEHVGVTQTTPIQNSQLTSKNQGYCCVRQSSGESSFPCLCVFAPLSPPHVELFAVITIFSTFSTSFLFCPSCTSPSLGVFALWGCCLAEWDQHQAAGQPPSVGR